MLNLGESQTSLLRNVQNSPTESPSSKPFKIMNSRNGYATFLHLNSKIGGQVNNNRPSVGQFLTKEQTRYIYKKTESGEIINTETTQTRSQAKSSDIKLPEVHGMGKNLDPNTKLENQHANSKQGSVKRPCIGQ